MRSKLFVPGSRPELFAKALAGPADAISIDIEDAVDESRKAEARAAVVAFLSQRRADVGGKTVIVRINGRATRHFEADVSAIVGAAPGRPLDLINLPMAECADDVRAADASLTRHERTAGLTKPIGLLVNIETPRALRRAAEIAGAAPRVVGLQLGLGDLFEPLGIDRADVAAVQQVQLAVRLAAGEAGVWAYDTAFANVADAEGFRQEAARARALGFLGKSCIHPTQVPLANAAFRPSDKEIAHAERVVAAAQKAAADGVGAFMVDGRMVDAPFIRRAEQVLAVARRLAGEGRA
jgi:citrate lyase subunit beta/citryl-CoA lyase